MIRMFVTSAAAFIMLFAAAPLHGQDLKVTLLGTGRPDPAIDRFGPGTLVEAGNQALLFDSGRGVSQRLWQMKMPLSRVDALFLTHLHSDHVVGIPDLWLTGWLPTPFGRRTVPLQVAGPEGTRAMMSSLREAYQWDIRVRRDGEGLPAAGVEVAARDIRQGVVYERDGLKVTAFEVDHGGILQPAFGYRVDYGGRSVVISGDTRPSENLVAFARNADVVIHEVSAARPELLARSPVARRIVGFHTSPEDAGRIFERVKPKLAVYSHIVLLTTDPAISAPALSELAPRTRTTYLGPLEIGEDLMTILIGQSVEVRRFVPPAAAAAPAHESFEVQSAVLGEARRINVYTPPAYHASSAERFPVLYMPDGGVDEDFVHVIQTVDSLVALGRIRPVMVVGIPNTERRRDLTGATRFAADSAIAPRVGGAAAFRRFLRDELIPAVDARYRTSAERAIIGESLAGLFILETFLVEPALFDHYIALDPSVWWDGGSLAATAPARLSGAAPSPRTLYLASTEVPEIAAGVERIAAALRTSAPPGLAWMVEPHPELTHATIYRALKPDALARVFK